MGDQVGDQAFIDRSRPLALLVALLVATAAMGIPAPHAASAEPAVEPEDGPLIDGEGGPNGDLDPAVARAAGRVTDTAGEALGGVIVDLFRAAHRGAQRVGYLRSIHTASDGGYALELPEPGCYRLEFVLPSPSSPGPGRRRDTAEFCTDTDTGSDAWRFDAVLDGVQGSRIVGRVAYETGEAASAVMVELFHAGGDGSRGALVETLATRRDGSFRLPVGAGCYVVVVLAPGAERFSGSGREGRHDVCLGAGAASDPIRVTLEGDAPPATTLSAVELEILRLTNQLRADPSGPLRRRRPLPPCVSEDYYEITVDPTSGQPEAVPPLEMNETTSNALARSWAIEMARSGRFRHRPSATQQQLYASLDVAPIAWGENIAWSDGYAADGTARIHFEGWRESETGHYCTLVTRRFTHVGIGEYRAGNESWAVQNFYAVAPD